MVRMNQAEVGSDGTQSFKLDVPGARIELFSRGMPEGYGHILSSAKQAADNPQNPVKWDQNAIAAWRDAYRYIAQQPEADEAFVFSELNEIGARMNGAVNSRIVGMAANRGDNETSYYMTIHRPRTPKNPTFGVPIDDMVSLGPFQHRP